MIWIRFGIELCLEFIWKSIIKQNTFYVYAIQIPLAQYKTLLVLSTVITDYTKVMNLRSKKSFVDIQNSLMNIN